MLAAQICCHKLVNVCVHICIITYLGHYRPQHELVPYVHNMRQRSHPRCCTAALQFDEVKRTDTEVEVRVSINRNNPHPLLSAIHQPKVEVTCRGMLPLTAAVSFDLPYNVSTKHFFSICPIAADRSRLFYTHIRNFARVPLLDTFAAKSMKYVAGQDQWIIERLRPDLIEKEISLGQDLAQIEFRKLRSRYIKEGRGIPAEFATERIDY